MNQGLTKIAALLGTQPHLKEGLGEIAELITAKLAETETSHPQAKGKKPKVDKKAKKSEDLPVTTLKNTKLSTVKLNWKEVYYTNCPLVSASNVDQELGWTREENKRKGRLCNSSVLAGLHGQSL